jgi:hypothetical protein
METFNCGVYINVTYEYFFYLSIKPTFPKFGTLEKFHSLNQPFTKNRKLMCELGKTSILLLSNFPMRNSNFAAQIQLGIWLHQ